MEVYEIHNRKRNYCSDQAKAENVSHIVAGYASAGAFGIFLVRAGTTIGFLVFRCQLVGHESLSIMFMAFFHQPGGSILIVIPWPDLTA
jgi:hypothetical protein